MSTEERQELLEEAIADERHQQSDKRVFISYRSQEPDASLAREFHDRLKASGYEAFMAAESINWGENWVERIDKELKRCDYFLLLLSEQSASSDMVAEEVRTASRLRDKLGKPAILPVRVNLSVDEPLNYELRSFLQTIQQREWKSEADTPVILSEILTLLSTGEREPPPQPAADLELPEGQVPLDSPFYVERPPIEADCYEMIVQPGSLIRVKAPRQMGKSSLMARILHHAAQAGYSTASLNFELVNEEFLTNLDQFLQWFCAIVSEKLNLPKRLADYWEGITDSMNECTNYFERYLLSTLENPLALGLDNVDRVFRHPEIATDFFGLLRGWHEEGKNEVLWQKLRLVIVHSKEVYIPLDINQSPFNVGFPVELSQLTPSQVEDLAGRHGLDWSVEQVEALMAMCGGHPYLIRVALYEIGRGRISLAQLLQAAPTDEGLYQDHLRRHLLNLEQDEDLVRAFKKVLATNHPVQIGSSKAFKLRSMGLVKFQGNEVVLLCDLYRQYFRNRLGISL